MRMSQEFTALLQEGSAEAWPLRYKGHLQKEADRRFRREDCFFWFADGKSIELSVFDVGADQYSTAEIDFSPQEPHVYVTIKQYADSGDLVTSWFEGKLLHDSTEYPDIPFSEPVVRSSIREGYSPKVFVPGDWAGHAHHYKDVTVTLPEIPRGGLVVIQE